DVVEGEVAKVWATHADFLGLVLGFFQRPAVAQYAPDHPKRSHAVGCGAVDERGTVGCVVGGFQEVLYLGVFRVGVIHRNVDVTQAQFAGFRGFLFGVVLARAPEVDDGADTLLLQLFQFRHGWLATGTNLFVDPQEVFDGGRIPRRLLRRGGSRDREKERQA